MRERADVLVVGGGPVGLMLALELQRRGVDHLVIDQRPQPDYYCKALGITPRTLEVWDQCGVVEDALRRGIFLQGVDASVGGETWTRETVEADGMPYGFLSLPQYETEDILRTQLGCHGGRVEQGARLVSFDKRGDGYLARVATGAGEREVACRWLAGCDGAHSTVRHNLGIAYEGDAYAMTFVLADVRVHWDRPHAFGQRLTLLENGELRNILICIPIPGDPLRFRVSCAAPPELQDEHADLSQPPSLERFTAMVAPMLPAGTKITDLCWSSYYRISHRIVSRYADGNAFLVGDAAHIHPPIGGQGMNTGIQDAHNLAWKLALASRGRAVADLLESYDAERRPVGLDVVNRATRRMDASLETGEVKFNQWLEDSQLLNAYRGSRWVGEDDAPDDGPRPGDRAPEATGLERAWVQGPLRVADLVRQSGHVLLLHFGAQATTDDFARAAALADRVRDRHGDEVVPWGIVAPRTKAVDHERFPLLRDAAGEFARAYGATGNAFYLLRPDRHLGARASGHDAAAVERALARTLLPGA
jgi:2-polyprenyl-6-methoxyphenol hydroxylase-like FAD-dependent oxidoreductase